MIIATHQCDCTCACLYFVCVTVVGFPLCDIDMRDITADILTEICMSVSVEPTLH